MNYLEQYKAKLSDLHSCLHMIESGDRVSVAGVGCEPIEFLSHLEEIIPDVTDVTLTKSKDNDYSYLRDPNTKGHIFTVGHFYHKNFRQGHALGMTSYIPSDLHNYMAERVRYFPNNVFIAQVADMDPETGCFQIPYAQMFEREAFAPATKVILEVNPNFRRVRGAVDIPIDRVTAFYISEKPLFTIPRTVPTEMDKQIGRYVADLIHDGDTIQLGIGGLPDAVGEFLHEKNDLGVHSELFSSTMADLIEAGNINGKYKSINKGEHLATFAIGDQHLFDVISTNPACRLMPSSYGNDPFIIAQNDNMKSVNTAVEIDLTGQICSESVGPTQISGTGGATDYAYGAMHSKGGRSIIAFSSTTKGGTVSKIVPILTPGAAVSITRNHADTIVTEYGIAELRGRTVRERAQQLIAIAHPDFRAELTAAARKYGYIE